MESTLSLNMEEPVKRKRVNKYKIISGVLLVALVAMSLGLGLGLGLKKEKKQPERPSLSCRQRCYNTENVREDDCRCDSQCTQQGNCCIDFDDLCNKPKEEWTCSKVRCGETRIEGSHCSCSDDCLTKGDCCTNYHGICKGETLWADDTECASSATQRCPAGFDLPPVILFSLDGFRANYLDVYADLMPNIKKLRDCGTHSKYMRSVYPTKTFPNHYTIVTGLFPESNGIIDNNMYDFNMNKMFSLSGNEKFNSSWWEGQPIWLTAMYQGLKAGTFFWPGSDVPINGSYPTNYELYNGSVTYEERITSILHWLDLPKNKRPDFYTLYIEEPDSSGHSFGPVSGGVILALLRADKTVGMLMDGLKQRNLHNCVNMVLVADHGMEKTYCEQLEYMTDYFQSISFFWLYDGPAARMRAYRVPQDYLTFDSEGIVKNLTCRKSEQHFRPYMKQDLPKRFHYANHIRIDKVHLYVDRQWLVVRDPSYTFCGGGNHGYDNEFKSMEAIFVGHGPGFKQKVEVEAFDNIELYNLMCDLLKIHPAPNNGTHGSLNHLLTEPIYNPTHVPEKSTPSTCTFAQPSSNLNCSCNLVNEADVNARLNLDQNSKTESEEKNLPYGRPRNVYDNSTYCLLHQQGYVSGYSHDILMPLWTAYTVEAKGEGSTLPPTVADCLRPDGRVPEASSQKCSDYKLGMNITHSFLHPPNFNSSELEQYDSLITSNLVPMYKEFFRIWNYLHNVLMLKYANERNGLNVISGPIFDYNYDGHIDAANQIQNYLEDTKIPIPTHYFIVLTSCKNTTHTPISCSGNLKVLSFIIPHRLDNSESCADNKPEEQWVEERLKVHTARVRDVELLTGLDFYQGRNQPITDLLQLKTFLPTFETIVN
ncbi:PREDICTED: ectonucleotide pyrophosphatase/phosphodiesterase family member 3 [Nanorana parkeri]|uniref:ectonucleotide pyrophosphatase/phosphodiesterase family member 3 n=1 Tax=Nanorana parkeri TaxID=125878 RepID=UPI000854DF07|nr:PREDICTED: ectonucleotide pyrophosphatase/phosphodiesterase family member 3 [Nanorana parkeri]